jgi:DNA-binding HxlR family transcriptional regulator
MVKRKIDILFLGRVYVVDILFSLLKSPKRFVDLSEVCPNEKTRSIALKKLEKLNLISTISLKINKRYFVHYKLTKKGQKVTEKILEVKKLL